MKIITRRVDIWGAQVSIQVVYLVAGPTHLLTCACKQDIYVRNLVMHALFIAIQPNKNIQIRLQNTYVVSDSRMVYPVPVHKKCMLNLS